MADYTRTMESVRLLETLSEKKSIIHDIHPVIKLLTTIFFLVATVSFGRYDWLGMIPFIVYPLIVFLLTDFSLKPFLVRLAVIVPFLLTMGILNPILDHYTVSIGGFLISRGWITFASILIKSCLTVLSVFLLMATTRLEEIAKAMRAVKIPRIFVLQLLLTYRYIHILMDEVGRVLRSYYMRAPRHRGVHHTAWSSLVGTLFLRTYDRSQRVYQAMNLRGFSGEYYTGNTDKISKKDMIYFLGWSAFFILGRMINIPIFIGNLL